MEILTALFFFAYVSTQLFLASIYLSMLVGYKNHCLQYLNLK